MYTLNNFDAASFIRDYWQKKPLLMRQALPGFQSPLEPDDLAGMACEPDIESRLITDCASNWKLEHGPLSAERFSELDNSHWTLLVQAVDHWLPELAELRSAFNFIPNWLVDDVMASYATRGGCVGPHFDQYDVFLVQGAGKRQWQVGQHCNEMSTLRDHPSLKLLDDFQQQEVWTLEPGDILYLPPGFAHWGVAQDDDCITYSIGFRAPSYSDLIANYCDDVLSNLNEDQRYCDPELKLQANPGQITSPAIDQVEAVLKQMFMDRQQLQNWFGRYMTEPKYSELHQEQGIDIDEADLVALLSLTPLLHRNPASRCAYTDTPSFTLYVDGVAFPCDSKQQDFAKRLCAQSSLDTRTLSMADCASLIHTLFCQGALYIDDGED